MKQRKLFQVTLTRADKAAMRVLADRYNKPYGIFFDTSGKARMEPINPNALYQYVWRTDQT